jgi:uncharacterized Zn-finger protein
MLHNLPTDLVLKERYNFNCPSCKKGLFAKPGMAMLSGLNSGHGTCPYCKTFFHLRIDENNERMIAQDWNKFMENPSGGYTNG